MQLGSETFSVCFGKIGRTLEYREGAAALIFTFDRGERWGELVLEHHGVRKSRPPNYDVAFLRCVEFLRSKGYGVIESGVARLPEPITADQAAAITKAAITDPVPSSITLREPVTRTVFKDDSGDTPWSLWLVAELAEGPHRGHKLVFDEHTRQFGVASPSGVFLGFWGSFTQTINALVGV
jgi:hypothetical protein